MNVHPVGQPVPFWISAKMKCAEFRWDARPIGRAIMVAKIRMKFITTKTVCSLPCSSDECESVCVSECDYNDEICLPAWLMSSTTHHCFANCAGENAVANYTAEEDGVDVAIGGRPVAVSSYDDDGEKHEGETIV